MASRGASGAALALLAALALGGGAGAQETERGYLSLDGDSVYWEAAGSGPAVVLLHDGLVHSEGWDEAFAALASRYRVVRYDRRGYGRSGAATVAHSPLDDLEALLDHLGVRRAALVGASAGGAGALDFALAHPDRVSALLLVGPVIGGYPFSEHFVERGRRNMEPVGRGDYEAAMRRWVDDRFLIAPGNDEARSRMWELVRPYARKHLTLPFVHLRPPERAAVAHLHEITVPTLVLVGEADAPDVHAHAGVIEAGVPGARRIVLEGAGHLLFLERPDAFEELVVEFLADVPPSDPPSPAHGDPSS